MKQIVFLILFGLLSAPAFAQSTNENFPTPIVQNEVSGTIAARDIGDARLTHYFYVFSAANGDVDLEVETTNFDGDVDLFESETLRPLTKITIAADGGTNKTKRQIYFRKRAQIILRIEGKSLTDDAATYRIAFSGSFLAATDLEQLFDTEPKVTAKSNPDAPAKVNSAGTIIEVLTAKTPVAKSNSSVEIESSEKPPVARRTPQKNVRVKPKIAASKIETAAKTDQATIESSRVKQAQKLPSKAPQPKSKTPAKPAKVVTAKKSTAKKTADETAEKISQPDPLSNIQLVILLKNGDRVERLMSEVFNVSVDKGLITVITKAGKILRYNLLDVQKMTIE